MKDCRGIHTYRPTGHEKKEQMNHRYTCRCLNPFVKLHYPDCPVISMKTCPIHGNEKNSKGREQNVIISFHPSSKTERLLQPIKSLLTNCNSKTKINFQYYTPGKVSSVDSVKPSNGQNPCENVRKSFNNVFIERTKSFVAEKTNKVRKLRRCFHSPCDSVVRKTRSQTSLKERLNQVFSNDVKRKVLYEMMPEIPPNDKNDWFYSSVGGAFNYRKLSEERLNSDFVTVTRHDNNNFIHHNIFELKNNYNDISFDFPKQTNQFAYFVCKKKKKEDKACQSKESLEKREENEESGSEKGVESTASSGSVYMTPFFLFPKEMAEEELRKRQLASQVDESVQASDFLSESDRLKNTKTTQTSEWTPKEVTQKRVPQADKGVQVSESVPVFESISAPSGNTKSTQTSHSELLLKEYLIRRYQAVQMDKSVQAGESIPVSDSITSEAENTKSTQTPQLSLRYVTDSKKQTNINKPHKAEMDSVTSEPKSKSVLLQTEDFSQQSSRFLRQTTNPPSEATMQEIYLGNNANTYDGGSAYDQSKQSAVMSEKALKYPEGNKPVEVQTSNSFQFKEVVISARWEGSMKDQTSQTEELWNVQLSVKTFASKTNKSQGTVPRYSDKEMQTLQNQTSSKPSTSIHFSSNNTMHGYDPSDPSSVKMEKTWWGKSHSDTDIVETTKCSCHKEEDEQLYPQSKVLAAEGTQSVPHSVTLRTKETIERVSDRETSSKEKEFTASAADLSDLKKFIQEFFDGGNHPIQELEKPKVKGTESEDESSSQKYLKSEKPERQPAKELVDKSTQTSTSSIASRPTVASQTDKMLPKVDAEAQTDVRVLIGEVEQEEEGQKKVKLVRTAIVDPKSQTKSFFVCAVCGRNVGEGADAATSTINVSIPRKKIKTSEIEQTCEIQVRATKIKIPRGSETDEVGPPNRPRNNSIMQPPSTYRVRNAENRNSESEMQSLKVRATTYKGRNDGSTDEEKTPVVSMYVNEPNASCECCTSSSCIMPTSETRSSGVQKPNTRERPEAERKRRREFAYPVLTKNFWPRSFIKDWKSAENALSNFPFSHDPNLKILKQKSSLEKDFESFKRGGADDKMRDFPVFGEPGCSGLLTMGKDGGFKFWPSDKSKQQIRSSEDVADATPQINPGNDREDIYLESALPGVMVRGVQGDYQFWPRGTQEYHSRMLLELNETGPASESLINQESFHVDSDQFLYGMTESQSLENNEELSEEHLVLLYTPRSRKCYAQSASSIQKLEVAPSVPTTQSLNLF